MPKKNNDQLSIPAAAPKKILMTLKSERTILIQILTMFYRK